MSLKRACLWLLLATAVLSAQTRKTKNIVLITADGLRWQEVFNGIDPLLMNEKAAGMEDAKELREKFWAPSAEARRKLLMPFFWETIARRGVVLGNVQKGSSVRVTNAFRVSYPGYSEILTGRAQDDLIRGNKRIQNPNLTVLEFLRQKLNLDASQVALFGSWDMFTAIGEHTPGSVVINAGYSDYTGPGASQRMRELSHLQFQMLTPWPSARHDHVTAEMGLEYLKSAKPRMLYITLDETDDWAHDKKYGRVLELISYFDRFLKELFSLIDDSTSVIITADHGRGSTLSDWNDHGARVSGADQIWMAIVGPDTPARGEASDVPEVFQRDVTPTILSLLGIDTSEMEGVQGKPIPMALKPGP